MSNELSRTFLILGDQLFPLSQVAFKKKDKLYFFEDKSLATHFKYHKNKLIFFFSAMREYAKELESKGYNVCYYEASHKLFESPFSDKISEIFKKNKKDSVLHTYEINDHFFKKELSKSLKSLDRELQEHRSPMFLTPKKDFEQYLEAHKSPFMMTFYKDQRDKLGLLLNKDGSPRGGQWSFDEDNRKKYPKKIIFPDNISHRETKIVKDVKVLVEKEFVQHPGDTDNFWLPVKREQALRWLHLFVEQKLEKFGPYEDAIHSENVFGFHSNLSALMNIGLLTPEEVVQAVIEKGEELNAPLSSIEGFVRQVIGWREFVKGIYDNYSERMLSENFWGHKNKLNKNWYQANTGIDPLDDSINKVKKWGYCHHIERLMIQSNLMLLCEIAPRDVYKWFMEMYVDSADWVMVANVFGMGQFSEGGIFATKPYICGSNYIRKMSNYPKGDWCDIVDGLYWRFIHKNKKTIQKNHRMSMMVKMLEKMDSDRKNKLFRCAEEFISQKIK